MSLPSLFTAAARLGAVPLLLLAPLAVTAAPAVPAGQQTVPPASAALAVAWQVASTDAEIDRALGQARASGRPVLLYWGARWCPPCNQLKATLFPRADFIALSRHFVAVHVDGDRPGAQRVSQRFEVSGYPTVLVLSADGAELARLPGEVDAAQFVGVLQATLSGGRPLKAVLDDALAGRPLPPAAWRMLAMQAWDNGGSAPDPALPDRLVRLARAHPQPDGAEARRLWVKALALAQADRAPSPDAALRASLERLLDDPAEGRAQLDLLIHHGDVIAKALRPAAAGTAEGTTGSARLEQALQRLQADPSLSRADRMDVLAARVERARAESPAPAAAASASATAPAPRVSEALQRTVREAAAAADREITDGHERQAVITTAAHALARAGLWEDSEALLKANLSRSHSPYYLMSQLGALARERGRPAEALDWHARAWSASDGPATRLQWGASYLRALVELAPQDTRRIEQVAGQLWEEAGRDRASFTGRSLRSLQRAGRQLLAWNAQGTHGASLERLQRRLDAVCAQASSADGQREVCRTLLRPASAPAGSGGPSAAAAPAPGAT